VQVKQEKKVKQIILSGCNRASGGETSGGQQLFHVCITSWLVYLCSIFTT